MARRTCQRPPRPLLQADRAMRVLSLFDGISCGQVALQRIGIKPSVYFASEIDKSAIAITQRNFPNTIQLGGVQAVRAMVEAGLLGHIDLLIGGSPCQGFSRIGRNRGFDDPRSQLLFDYVAIRHRLKQVKFLLENVRMTANDNALVTALIGCSNVEIDSAMFTGQRRKRNYWTNIHIAPIHDRKVSVRSVIEQSNRPNTHNWHVWFYRNYVRLIKSQLCSIVNDNDKAITLLARHVANWQDNIVRLNSSQFRHLTPREAERLQTLPDDYTIGAALTKRYHHIGNGWTVDVIAHILKGML